MKFYAFLTLAGVMIAGALLIDTLVYAFAVATESFKPITAKLNILKPLGWFIFQPKRLTLLESIKNSH